MSKYFKLSFVVLVTTLKLYTTALAANEAPQAELTIEELRLEKAMANMPEVVKLFNSDIDNFKRLLSQSTNLKTLTQVVESHSHSIWKKAVSTFKNSPGFDDRPLYWA